MAEQDPDAGAVAPELPDDHPSSRFGAEAEAVLDKALSEMLGGEEDDDADLHVAAAREPRHPKAKAEPPEDEEPSEEDEDEEPAEEEDELEGSDDSEEEEGEVEEDEDEDMALHRAYTVLHDQVGVPASVLKKTSRAELIAWAKRVEAKREDGGGTPSSPERGRESSDGAKATGGPAADSTDARWAPIRAALAEKLGVDEDTADAIKPLHDRLVALEAKQEQHAADAKAREGRTLIDKEMRRLERSYPALKKDSELRQKTLDKAMTIAAGLKERGRAIDPRSVFDEAAAATKLRKVRSDLSQLRRNGNSVAPESIGTGRSADYSDDEDGYWGATVDLAWSGKGVDAIRRVKPPPMKQRKRQ